MPGHFPPFIFFLQNIPHQLFLHSPLSAACSFCSFPLPVTLPLFLKSCIYILLRCGSPSQSCSTATLRRRLPSLLLLFAFSPQSGGLSRLIYNASGVGQIFTLTLCAWVHPACREEREGESKNGRISVTELQQTEGEKEGELEGCEHWWAERRRLSSFTHPSSQALQHLLRFFFFKPRADNKAEKCVREAQCRLDFFQSQESFFSFWHLNWRWLSTCTWLCPSWSGASTASAPQTPSMTCFIWWDSFLVLIYFTWLALGYGEMLWCYCSGSETPFLCIYFTPPLGCLQTDNRKLWVTVVSQSCPIITRGLNRMPK